jgi:ribosome-binding protein aMBF1 (putative translation factor)
MLRLRHLDAVPTSTTAQSSQQTPVDLAAPATLHRNLNDRFGERLRELRRERNMTQLRMAVDFGIDRSFISDVERGRKSISLQMLEVIALGMKIELSELLHGI